jgi:hypothetical protein
MRTIRYQVKVNIEDADFQYMESMISLHYGDAYTVKDAIKDARGSVPDAVMVLEKVVSNDVRVIARYHAYACPA